MGALQYVDVPGYSALLLRKSFPDLEKPEALIPRSHEWLDSTAARWNGDGKQWTFPESGATISFGYMARANDHYQYQGAAYQYIGWDELTQFPDQQYKYLFSRLRRLEGFEVPLRVRSGSNPGGVGHQWVFERFVNRANTPDRIFLPALLDDNPFLDRQQYDLSLRELDPVEYARLRRGDWFVQREGLVFPEFESTVYRGEAEREGERVGGIDFGYHNPFAALTGCLDHDGHVWVWTERYQSECAISEHSRNIPRGVRYFADPAGADQIAELQVADHIVMPCVHLGPKPLQVGIDRVNNRIRRGTLHVHESCKHVRNEAGLYAYDELHPEREEPIDSNNHALSALRYLIVGLDRWHAIDYTAPDRSGEEKAKAEAETVAKREAHLSIDNEYWWGGEG